MFLISITKYRYLYRLSVSEIGKTIIYFNAVFTLKKYLCDLHTASDKALGDCKNLKNINFLTYVAEKCENDTVLKVIWREPLLHL